MTADKPSTATQQQAARKLYAEIKTELESLLRNSSTPPEDFTEPAISHIARLTGGTTPRGQIKNALRECATRGLIPGVHANIAATKNGNVMLLTSYRALLREAQQMEGVEISPPEIVYADDRFSYKRATDAKGRVVLAMEHERSFARGRSKGEVLAAYCSYATDAGADTMIIDADYIDSVKSSKPGTPWATHPEAMIKKTIVKRTLEHLGLDALVARDAAYTGPDRLVEQAQDEADDVPAPEAPVEPPQDDAPGPPDEPCTDEDEWSDQ